MAASLEPSPCPFGKRKDAPRTLDHRPVDHRAVNTNHVTGIGRLDDLRRPGPACRVRHEDAADGADLPGMDGELSAEPDGRRPAGVRLSTRPAVARPRPSRARPP